MNKKTNYRVVHAFGELLKFHYRLAGKTRKAWRKNLGQRGINLSFSECR